MQVTTRMIANTMLLKSDSVSMQCCSDSNLETSSVLQCKVLPALVALTVSFLKASSNNWQSWSNFSFDSGVHFDGSGCAGSQFCATALIPKKATATNKRPH